MSISFTALIKPCASKPSRRFSSPAFSCGANAPICWASRIVALFPGAANTAASDSVIVSTLRSLANCPMVTLSQSPAKLVCPTTPDAVANSRNEVTVAVVAVGSSVQAKAVVTSRGPYTWPKAGSIKGGRLVVSMLPGIEYVVPAPVIAVCSWLN